jgi:hypothetical protein
VDTLWVARFLKRFLHFVKRATPMEDHFDDLPESRATERLRGYSDWRMFHKRP